MDNIEQSRQDSVHPQSRSSVISDEDGKSAHESFVSTHEPFRDLDNLDVLNESMQALSAPTSRNFVLEFGDAHAHVAFDLDPSHFQTMLSFDRSESLSTRWINIWYPYHQRSVLEVLAQRYDFSPRLLALMCADPRRPSGRGSSVSQSVGTERARSHFELDSEHSRPSGDPLSMEMASLTSRNGSRTGNLYDIVEDVWHYSSVDQGRSYLCLGFNSLYSIGHLCPDVSDSMQRDDDEQVHEPLPGVRRIWTWLLLLSDRTVVTITEDLFPYSSGYLTPIQQRILLHTRHNLINVFRSLSKIDLEAREASPLTLLPIRRRLGETPEETAHRSVDASGLLFYYLFENWENSYSLVTHKESRYGIALQRVRREMFKSPKLAHIDRLDQIGCQLAVLKRHYKSYLRLIDRIVEPQKASIASLTNTRVASKASGESLSSPGTAARSPDRSIFAINPRTGQSIAENVRADGDGIGGDVIQAESLIGVSISSAARVRFERLRDMIGLYALSECKEYLHQKESLVQMNFQLIAIKESIDVERLTRAAFLISKATVLFLPVSFMTQYFSADFGFSYTVKTYWVTFSIVLVLSWLVLVAFSVFSGTIDSFPGVRQLLNCVRIARGHRQLGDGRSAMGMRSVGNV